MAETGSRCHGLAERYELALWTKLRELHRCGVACFAGWGWVAVRYDVTKYLSVIFRGFAHFIKRPNPIGALRKMRCKGGPSEQRAGGLSGLSDFGFLSAAADETAGTLYK